jgi:GNAT superfamily N-acetyltransferase
MTESHIDKCMEIQAACFEPHHCEDRQSYLDRMKLFPEGMVVLMVPTEPTEHQPVQWEIAGYLLYQPFFKGEIFYDGDTEKLEHAIASYRRFDGRPGSTSTSSDDMSEADDPSERRPNCLYTHELSISPKFRGKGLTSPLTSYVEEVAKSTGFDWLTLVSLPDPHPFWKKCGYHTHSEIDYEGAPCFYMEKRVARYA